MIIVGLGVALGVAVGLATRAVPEALGMPLLGIGGVIPVVVATAFLILAWFGLFVAAGIRREGPRGVLLAVGLLPVVAMLAAGPVAGLYVLLWPSILVTPAAFVVGARRSNV